MKDGRTNSSARRSVARPRLFISYRRRFDRAPARLLKEELVKAFGEGAAFRDVDDIPPGEAFPEAIREAVESCDTFLALISPGWLGVLEELRDPEDFVRREIAAALARRVPVIPVLLDDARMPAPEELPEEVRDLALRQAIKLSDDHWDYDVARLVNHVRTRTRPRDPEPFFRRVARALRPLLRTRPGKAVAAAAVAATLLAGAAALWPRAMRYAFTRDLEGCVSWHAPDGLGGVARIQPGQYDVPVVLSGQYQLAQGGRDEQRGVPFVVKLADSGRDVGAVFFRFRRAPVPADSTFTVERVVAWPCADVQDYRNNSRPAGDKNFLKNWDTLRVTIGGRDYYLRPDDSGGYVTASLTLTPRS